MYKRQEELSNVCLVISDLKATYESGSELLQSTFKELEDEITRFALNLEPVASASDEVYHIDVYKRQLLVWVLTKVSNLTIYKI